MENNSALKEKLCNLDIALVYLSAIANQDDGLNYALDNTCHPGSEEGRTVLTIKCCAEVHYKRHCRNKRGNELHNAGSLL